MSTLSNQLATTRAVRETLEDLIADPTPLGPDLEPVKRLSDDTVVGWQMLVRPIADVGDRAAFMRTALALGLAERLDWTLRVRTLEIFHEAGVTEPLHIKPSVSVYGTVPPPRLAVAFGRARRSVPVVAEVHEAALDDPRRLEAGLEDFRRWGWDLAVGDLSGRTDAGTLLQKIRPRVATVDLSDVGRSTSEDVRRYVDTALRLGIEVLAVGVDTPLRRGEAQNLGATLARGRAIGDLVDPSTL